MSDERVTRVRVVLPPGISPQSIRLEDENGAPLECEHWKKDHEGWSIELFALLPKNNFAPKQVET